MKATLAHLLNDCHGDHQHRLSVRRQFDGRAMNGSQKRVAALGAQQRIEFRARLNHGGWLALSSSASARYPRSSLAGAKFG